jgi:hypothetical protein
MLPLLPALSKTGPSLVLTVWKLIPALSRFFCTLGHVPNPADGCTIRLGP